MRMTYEQAKKIKKGDRIIVHNQGQSKELTVEDVKTNIHQAPWFAVSEPFLDGRASYEVNWRDCSLPAQKRRQ